MNIEFNPTSLPVPTEAWLDLTTPLSWVFKYVSLLPLWKQSIASWRYKRLDFPRCGSLRAISHTEAHNIIFDYVSLAAVIVLIQATSIGNILGGREGGSAGGGKETRKIF